LLEGFLAGIIIGIEVGIEIENDDRTRMVDPDSDFDFDMEKTFEKISLGEETKL
jgi:hypothetical protein